MLRALIATTLVFCIASASNCLAQIRVDGQVVSPSACHLDARDDTRVCPQVVVAVAGQLRFRQVSSRQLRPIRSKVGDNGDFSLQFKRRGRYKVSFIRSAGSSSNLVISPRVITVRSPASELFVVVHKSFGSTAPAKIASGCVG